MRHALLAGDDGSLQTGNHRQLHPRERQPFEASPRQASSGQQREISVIPLSCPADLFVEESITWEHSAPVVAAMRRSAMEVQPRQNTFFDRGLRATNYG